MKAIDTFSGPGGLSLGLRNAGFDVVLAFDHDEESVQTYERNLGQHVEQLDIRNVDANYIKNKTGIVPGELDLLAGGPPCQGFTKARRDGHLDDERRHLTLEYLRLVLEMKPRAFLMENVPIMAQKRGLVFISKINEELKDSYRLYPHYYNSADYGVAQTRKRYILVGIRSDIDNDFQIPTPTTNPWLTVREAIGDMPEPPSDYSHHADFFNHQAARVTQPNVFRFSFVPQGGGWKDIPYEHRLPCHQRVDTSRGGWPEVFGRLKWDGQCPTITGGFDSFTRGRYGHPEYDRPLTPREAARLQGFPDNFEFIGSRYHVRHQIGNAVPVTLAKAVGQEIAKAITD